ncbi:MAG TPA: pirin family protein [Nitriliruptorales bacterium]|nr:pirin family protein [Nitriliruptorales bacterium]
MPAITADPLALPRIPAPDPAATTWRPLARLVTAQRTLEGEGFEVRRPFPGVVSLREADPFLLLDHMGGRELAPYEARGAPDHPHRGFETVTYILDGALEHRDSTGSGGIIRDGDTQWMTAGAGIVHSEMPTHELYIRGGVMHGVQLWVNLPRRSKLVTPRYQDLTADGLTLLSSDDGGALLRLIAGDLDGHGGPGRTHTPIAYAHASISPGAQLCLPWRADFNALAYVLAGDGTVGSEAIAITEGQLAVLGPGDGLVLRAAQRQPVNVAALEVLLLGGAPIREPIFHYGPFVMNTRHEILQAVEDYQAGRMGVIPPVR